MDAARRATVDDLPVITVLARQAVEELSALRGGAVWARRDARQEPQDRALADALSASPADGTVVVGTIDDTVVGYGVGRIEPIAQGGTLAVVTDLYVEPEARGVGVGRAMMDELVAWAERAGAVGVDSLALPGDRATKNFFESFGLKARAIVVHRALGAAAENHGDAAG